MKACGRVVLSDERIIAIVDEYGAASRNANSSRSTCVARASPERLEEAVANLDITPPRSFLIADCPFVFDER